MPFDVRVEEHVARSPEVVAAYMFDPHHDPDWISGIEHVDPPAGPVGVGTETHRLAKSWASGSTMSCGSSSTSRTACW